MLQVVFTNLIIGLIFVCSSISLAAGGEPTGFSVGISGNGVTIFSLWMAQARGFYKKEGLNVEVIDMEGSTCSRPTITWNRRPLPMLREK